MDYRNENHFRWKFNRAENTKRDGPSVTKIEGNHHIHGQKNIAFSYSDPGGTLEKNKQPKTLI